MINLGDREIKLGSVNIHLFRMLSMYFISLSFMALYENALNQTGFKCGKPTMQTASLLISYGLMIILDPTKDLLAAKKYIENWIYCRSVTVLHQTAHILSVGFTRETGGGVYQTLPRYLDEEWACC